MALTWADFANGESALSIRNKLNTFNNAVVTDNATITSAVNTNAANIAQNTTDIAANTTDIATNASDITALEGRVAVNEDVLGSGVYDFVTLIGQYPTTPVTYNLTTTYQDVADYSSSGNIGFTVSETNGTFVPSTSGFYRISMFMSGTTSESSQKINTVALSQDGTIMFEGSTPFIDSTGLNRSFTAIFPLTAGSVYKLQMKANAASSVSFGTINFAAERVGQ